MTKSEKEKLISCFYDWIANDPYPEATAYQAFPDQKENPNISVHQAWKDGYEFAKKLVLYKLESL